MVTETEVDQLASQYTDRLIERGRVPETLRNTTFQFIRNELIQSLRKIARTTGRNAGMALAYQKTFRQ